MIKTKRILFALLMLTSFALAGANMLHDLPAGNVARGIHVPELKYQVGQASVLVDHLVNRAAGL